MIRPGHQERFMLMITKGMSALYTNILFANVWQFALSFLYLLLNGLLSCQLVGHEWDGFVQSRKTLRVSEPEGIQRSTYFLSIPWKYGIPLLVTMAFLHWSVSQSIFVTRIVSYFSDDTQDV